MFHLKPMKYCRIKPIQNGGAEIPIRTNTIALRSNNERGRRAERIPIGSEISIHRMAPPSTSDAVTGAASLITSLTLRRFANEMPSDGVLKMLMPRSKATGDSRLRKYQYWTGIG